MQEGRNMTMMTAPSKAVLAGRVGVGESGGEASSEVAHDGDVASAALESDTRRAQDAGNRVVADAQPEATGASPAADGGAPAEAQPHAPAEAQPDAPAEAQPDATASSP